MCSRALQNVQRLKGIRSTSSIALNNIIFLFLSYEVHKIVRIVDRMKRVIGKMKGGIVGIQEQNNSSRPIIHQVIHRPHSLHRLPMLVLTGFTLPSRTMVVKQKLKE